MAVVTIIKAERVGSTDVVIVTGTIDAVPARATAWVSATAGMTGAQKLAYAKARLTEQNPDLGVTNTDLGISG